MSDELTQDEANRLIQLEKIRKDSKPVEWPSLGSKLALELMSSDQTEEFVINATRSYIKLSKLSLNTRVRTSVVLVRLEIDGAPHRNPDDNEIECPHIHIYREGFGTKWAYPLPPGAFSDTSNQITTFKEFLRYCRVQAEFPTLSEGLF